MNYLFSITLGRTTEEEIVDLKDWTVYTEEELEAMDDRRLQTELDYALTDWAENRVSVYAERRN